VGAQQRAPLIHVTSHARAEEEPSGSPRASQVAIAVNMNIFALMF